MSELTTELIHDGDTWILKLIGSVDSASYHLMWPTESGASLLEKMVEAKVQKFVIDLTATERFDSLGLRQLLNMYKEISGENIQIALQNPNRHVKRLLEITQFDRVFVIEYSND